jgi:hypothetical protein
VKPDGETATFEPWEYIALLCEPWRWTKIQQAESLGVLVVVRCPVDGVMLDWRDQGLHLRSHGMTNERLISEIEARQAREWKTEG